MTDTPYVPKTLEELTPETIAQLDKCPDCKAHYLKPGVYEPPIVPHLPNCPTVKAFELIHADKFVQLYVPEKRSFVCLSKSTQRLSLLLRYVRSSEHTLLLSFNPHTIRQTRSRTNLNTKDC